MLERPLVGLSPKRLCTEAGMRIEPQVSLPQATAAKLAATAAPVPPELPPGFRRGSYGLRVWPPSELMVVIPAASSCRLVLPRMTAPRVKEPGRTWYALSAGRSPASARLDPVVGIQSMS